MTSLGIPDMIANKLQVDTDKPSTWEEIGISASGRDGQEVVQSMTPTFGNNANLLIQYMKEKVKTGIIKLGNGTV